MDIVDIASVLHINMIFQVSHVGQLHVLPPSRETFKTDDVTNVGQTKPTKTSSEIFGLLDDTISRNSAF